jgi:bis(5'-nucleosyl)-tetraphosphatase (symmetrical)
MATYAIGDVQGCHATLLQLLQRIRFDRGADRLWFVGDLVNRGPASLNVLRHVRDLGDAATVVLGNHDLHLLALAEGVRQPKALDTLQPVLDAPDCQELLDWLRELPLLHHEGDFLMVHAGLMPSWSEAQAEELAREVEDVLRGEHVQDLLRWMQDGHELTWHDHLDPEDRVRVALQVFTRLRTLTEDGGLCLEHTGPPHEAPAGALPWYHLPPSRDPDTKVLFGHWSTLGLLHTPQAIGLDTGCVWGGSLTALRLEDQEVFQEPAAQGEGRQPG